MGLTVNQDSIRLIDELALLKAELEEKLKQLDEQLLRLNQAVFYVAAVGKQPTTWDGVRLKRDLLLKASDWTMITGATVDQREWSKYRQILRDLPQTYAQSEPEQIIWPVEPSVAGPNTTPVE